MSHPACVAGGSSRPAAAPDWASPRDRSTSDLTRTLPAERGTNRTFSSTRRRQTGPAGGTVRRFADRRDPVDRGGVPPCSGCYPRRGGSRFPNHDALIALTGENKCLTSVPTAPGPGRRRALVGRRRGAAPRRAEFRARRRITIASRSRSLASRWSRTWPNSCSIFFQRFEVEATVGSLLRSSDSSESRASQAALMFPIDRRATRQADVHHRIRADRDRADRDRVCGLRGANG